MKSILERSLKDGSEAFVPIGYRLNDLMIQCHFKGYLCHRNLSSFFHPAYGNCYTFHHDENVNFRFRKNSFRFWTIENDDQTYSYKLFLELFVYRDEYIPHFDDRAAFRVFIHRKNEIPILSQTSFFLAPGVFTKLIFSYRQISFSRKCRTKLTRRMEEIFLPGEGRYSQTLCYKLCELNYLERLCRCVEPNFLVFAKFFRRNQTKQFQSSQICSMQNDCLKTRNYFGLFRRFFSSFCFFDEIFLSDSKQFCPHCLPECDLIQYTVQSSYADYPNTRSAEKVQTRVERYLRGLNYVPSSGKFTSSNRKDFLLEDVVAVEISASPYATEILSESPMYTWVDLISSIGGQTGRGNKSKTLREKKLFELLLIFRSLDWR